ncbi:MAG: asparagine synthase [Chamaesiphon sp.]|nr:asparagine synthase [Chamaesiphon sp.]
MIFRRNQPARTPSVTSRWLVAWGKGFVGKSRWCNEQLEIVSTGNGYTRSPSGRFLVLGDLWLSNRQELAAKLDLTLTPEITDLDLVARLWERWEIETPKLLQGMFGLAICDLELRQLLLIRDPVGARTIYYTTGETCWIASQLSSLNPYRSNQLDPIALRDYLTCAFVPGDRTMWQDVREIRPGTILKLPQGQIDHYWQLEQQVIEQESLVWHGDKLRSQLAQVVGEYLPAQAPVGVFLSGGLDSSCITALAAQLHDAPVHTYSIHFGSESANELEFSQLVAAHCQTHHHVLEISFKDMWAQLPQTMADLDDPIGDPLTVPNLLIGKLASNDVAVTLNGEGGDPCFGGPKNQPMLIDSLYNSGNNYDPLPAYLNSFQKCFGDLPQLLKPDILEQVQPPSIFEADLNSEMSYLNRLMALNIKFKGADQILTKVNNLTQVAKLQGLSPLFDRRIVELSMTIPPAYKLSGVQEKAVLKQAVADLLPATIIDRPKSGMMVPVQLGFRKYWHREAASLLLSRRALISPYINQDLIKEWLSFRGDIWGRYGVKLWLLVSLELWLQGNSNKN